jgi:hypothetical protein
MQSPPILRDGLENAALFPMSGPASWCILIPKRYCMEEPNLYAWSRTECIRA